MKPIIIIASTTILLIAIALSMYLLIGCQKNVEPLLQIPIMFDSEKPYIDIDYLYEVPEFTYLNEGSVLSDDLIQQSFLELHHSNEQTIGKIDSLIYYWGNLKGNEILPSLSNIHCALSDSYLKLSSEFSKNNLQKNEFNQITNSLLELSDLYASIGYNEFPKTLLKIGDIYLQIPELPSNNNENDLISLFDSLNYHLRFLSPIFTIEHFGSNYSQLFSSFLNTNSDGISNEKSSLINTGGCQACYSSTSETVPFTATIFFYYYEKCTINGKSGGRFCSMKVERTCSDVKAGCKCGEKVSPEFETEILRTCGPDKIIYYKCDSCLAMAELPPDPRPRVDKISTTSNSTTSNTKSTSTLNSNCPCKDCVPDPDCPHEGGSTNP